MLFVGFGLFVFVGFGAFIFVGVVLLVFVGFGAFNFVGTPTSLNEGRGDGRHGVGLHSGGCWVLDPHFAH